MHVGNHDRIFAMKTFAFIDASNLFYGGEKSLGWKIDYKKLLEYLKEKYDVEIAYIFIGYIQSNRDLYSMLQKAGYVLIFKPIIFDDDKHPKGNCDADLVLQAILEKDKFLPEFVNKLQGVNVGETKEIEITFPKSNDESVSGKKALFKVKINSIEEKIIPEINDELAKKVGMKDLVDLKEKIELQIKEIQEKNSQTEFENKLVEEVIKS